MPSGRRVRNKWASSYVHQIELLRKYQILFPFVKIGGEKRGHGRPILAIHQPLSMKVTDGQTEVNLDNMDSYAMISTVLNCSLKRTSTLHRLHEKEGFRGIQE